MGNFVRWIDWLKYQPGAILAYMLMFTLWLGMDKRRP